MNDKRYEEIKQETEANFAKWREILGLNRYIIDIAYYRGTNEENTAVLMDNVASWEYNRGNIRVFVEALEQQEKDTREEALVHELVHIVLGPLSPPVADWSPEYRIIAEKVVSNMSYNLTMAYAAGRNEPKPRKRATNGKSKN